MSNYQQTDAPGTAWKRCNKIIIDNPLVGAKSALFLEQDAVSLGGRTIVGDAGFCTASFNPASNIYIRDIQTGELNGNYVTQAYLYEILFSLYMQTALERDTPTTPAILGPAE